MFEDNDIGMQLAVTAWVFMILGIVGVMAMLSPFWVPLLQKGICQ